MGCIMNTGTEAHVCLSCQEQTMRTQHVMHPQMAMHGVDIGMLAHTEQQVRKCAFSSALHCSTDARGHW